jgi:hypothetical protein
VSTQGWSWPVGVRPAWLVPTARAIAWRPVLGGLGAVVASLAAVEAWGAQPLPAPAASLALAVAVAAPLQGLDDPAQALLAALPTSGLRRLRHRLTLVLSAVLVVGLAGAVTGIGRTMAASGPPLVGGFAALLAVGVLLHVVLTGDGAAATTAASGLPVLLAVLAAVTDPNGIGALAHGWATHPWPLAIVAAASVVIVERCRWRRSWPHSSRRSSRSSAET